MTNFALDGVTPKQYCITCTTSFVSHFSNADLTETKTVLAFSDDMDGITTDGNLYPIYVNDCVDSANK